MFIGRAADETEKAIVVTAHLWVTDSADTRLLMELAYRIHGGSAHVTGVSDETQNPAERRPVAAIYQSAAEGPFTTAIESVTDAL